MAAQNYLSSLAIILREEGGNDDDPRDHGGRTSRGITQSEWDIYRKSHPDRPTDVWQAPQQDVENIYKLQYWDPYCDELPAGIDLEFFNASVNSGRQQAVKELQRAVGTNDDGMFGMKTLAAVNDCEDIPALVSQLADRRRAFYQALKQFSIYGKGWMARTARVETAALEMARSQPVVARAVDTKPDEPNETISAKANPLDVIETTLSTQTAAASTAGSSVISGVSDQLQTVSSSITPLADTFKWIKIACIVIAVLCAGLTIYAVVHERNLKKVV